MSPVIQSPSAPITFDDLLIEANDLAAKVTSLLGAAPQLTNEDIRRSAKLRKGGTGILPTILALSEKEGLVIPMHPIKVISDKKDLAEHLVALQKELLVLTKHVSDALFLAQSAAWAGATVHYATLRRLAKSNGDLARALAPVTQFFAARSASAAAAQKARRGGARKGTKKKAPHHAPGTGATAPAGTGGHGGATGSEAPPTETPAPTAGANGPAH